MSTEAETSGGGTAAADGPGGRPSPYAVGDLLGDYRIECLLGRGGMGFVYGATNTLIGKRAAVKVLARHVAAPEMIERFITEARAVNQIGHPNIVDVFGFGATDAGDKYMVMEWLRGESLADRMQRPMTAAEICGLLGTVADALAAAHAKGIVHRDLKPDNVFLHDDGRGPVVKLLDFGIAKLLGAEELRADRTRTGYLMGTPAYMSPEQARGKDVDHRSDLYSLGVIAFELFTGTQPFEHETPMDLVVAHLQEEPRAPSVIRAEVPAAVDRLVLAMLEKSPAARPSLSQIKVALTAIALDRAWPVTLPPRTPPHTMAPATAVLAVAAAPPPLRSSSTIGLAAGQTEVPLPRRRRWAWPLVLVGALATALVVVVVARHGAPTTRTPAGAPAPGSPAAAQPIAPAAAPPPVIAPDPPTPPPSAPVTAPVVTAGPGRPHDRGPRRDLAAPLSYDAAPPPAPDAGVTVVLAPPPSPPTAAPDAGVARPPPVDDRDGTLDPFAHP